MLMYELKIINTSNIETVEEFNIAFIKATPTYYKTLKEVFAKCGCKLSKQRYGYAGTKGNTEYFVTKVNH